MRNLQSFAGSTYSHHPLFPHLWWKWVLSATPFYEEISGKNGFAQTVLGISTRFNETGSVDDVHLCNNAPQLSDRVGGGGRWVSQRVINMSQNESILFHANFSSVLRFYPLNLVSFSKLHLRLSLKKNRVQNYGRNVKQESIKPLKWLLAHDRTLTHAFSKWSILFFKNFRIGRTVFAK